MKPKSKLGAARLLAPLIACAVSSLALWGQSVPRKAEVPPDLVPVFNQGVGALQAGRYDEAESAFQEVLRKAGPSSLIYTNLGMVYQQRGDHQKASELLRKAIPLAPQSAPPRVLLGSSLLALGKIPEATQQLERAVKLAPNDPLAHVQLGKAYTRGKRSIPAIEEFRKARRLSPADPDLAYRLGTAYLELSVWTLREIIRLDPKSPRVDQMMAENYRSQGRNDRALRFYQFAAENGPRTPDIHLAMAQIYQSMGNTEEALQEVTRELEIVPGHVEALELKKQIETAASAGPQ